MRKSATLSKVVIAATCYLHSGFSTALNGQTLPTTTGPAAANDRPVTLWAAWYFHGGPLPDDSCAIALRTWVAKHNTDSAAKFLLAEALQTPDQKAIVAAPPNAILPLLTQSSAAGYAPAQATLGLRLFVGNGIAKDVSAANKLLKQSLVGDDPVAHFQMVFYIAAERKTDEMTTRRALAHATLAIKGGFVRACLPAAQLYQKLGDSKSALEIVRTGAEAGDTAAQLQLSKWLHSGEMCPQDDGRAFDWATRATRDGEPAAQRNLADFCAQGIGTPTDPKRAFELYASAAEAGDIVAKEKAAELCLTGVGTAFDIVKGRAWMLEAAAGGDRDAMFAVGRAYVEGLWLDRDLIKATQYFEAASNLGVQSAKYYLTLLDHQTTTTQMAK